MKVRATDCSAALSKSGLEAIPYANFRREGVRQSCSAWSNERDRFSERTGAEITTEGVAKVGAIRQIEELDESGKIVMFAKLEVLCDPRVKLEKPLTAKIVKRSKLTLP